MEHMSENVSESQRRAITDDDRMLYLMDDISRGARRLYDAGVRKTGLNQTQWRIIGQILRNSSQTQADIAKLLELEPATIGQAVAALCDKGLMERRRAEADRRAWQLNLTAQIDTLLPKLRASADHLHSVLWHDITDDEKHAFQRILAKISGNLERYLFEPKERESIPLAAGRRAV
jgi:MarR family transcriptional regulator, transcriptional regulator for hemolysin